MGGTKHLRAKVFICLEFIIRKIVNMLKYFVFLVILASAFGEDDDGLMDCLAGSETGDKVAAAIAACANEGNSAETRATAMCYDFNSTVAWLYEAYGNDMCILYNMGWLNENGTGYNWDQWMTDIATLPEEVSGALMEGKDEWELCWQDHANAWSQDPCFNGTDSLYSEEEKEIVAQIAVMIAQYDCFKYGLVEACSGNDMDVLEQCVTEPTGELSSTGEKLEDAFEFCFEGNHTEPATRSLAKKLLSREMDNDTQCYNYNDTMGGISSYYQDDSCVLGHMGWFMNNGTMAFNFTAFADDINGLPEATSMGIWDKTEEWDECVAFILDNGSQHPCWAGESSLYSDEEREELGQIFTMIAQYECFRHYFHETCFELYGQDDYDNGDYYTK